MEKNSIKDDFKIVKERFFGKKSETNKFEKCIIMAILILMAVLSIIDIYQFVNTDSCWDKFISAILGYVILFEVFASIYYLVYKFKIRDVYRNISSILFMPILGVFVFLKRRNFIFIADFYIEICAFFIGSLIIATEIGVRSVRWLIEFLGTKGSLEFEYLCVFVIIFLTWYMYKGVLHIYIFKIRKKAYKHNQNNKNMYFDQMCHQLKYILYLCSIVIMLCDYIKGYDNSHVLHILDVCFVVIFALDTVFQNWDYKMKLNTIEDKKS